MRIFNKLADFFFLCLLIVFPFGQLTRLPDFNLPLEVNIYLTDIFLLFTLAFWIIGKIFTKEKFSPPKLMESITCFILTAGLSLLINVNRLKPNEFLISGLYFCRWILYVGIYLFLNERIKRKVTFFNQNNLKKGLLILGCFIAVFGLVQYLVWPDLRLSEVYGWDPHYFRVVGTFFDPGFTGLILVFTLILVYPYLFNKKAKKSYFVVGFLVYLAFALTYSRSSYLAFLAGFAAISWLKKSVRIFLFSLLLILLTVIILPRHFGGEGVKLERWASVRARIENWNQAITIFSNYPILGVGFNSYRYAQRDFGFLSEDWRENHAGAGSDSSFLLVLATTGVIGAVFYIYLWCRIFKMAILDLVVFPTLIALWTHSFFLNSQFYPWILVWLWILLAAVRRDGK